MDDIDEVTGRLAEAVARLEEVVRVRALASSEVAGRGAAGGSVSALEAERDRLRQAMDEASGRLGRAIEGLRSLL